jgi:ribosomal protein S18 acetylase RimI-like enzyme
LCAFQANTGACRFYERHGFTVIDVDDEGARNEEREPDVYYGWSARRAVRLSARARPRWRRSGDTNGVTMPI